MFLKETVSFDTKARYTLIFSRISRQELFYRGVINVFDDKPIHDQISKIERTKISASIHHIGYFAHPIH